MNTSKIIALSVLSTLLGSIGTGIAIHMAKESKISHLETMVLMSEWQNVNLTKENYQLHIDLIERDNPYQWEVYGGAFSNSGYRRMVCNEIGYCYYEYLEKDKSKK